MDRSKGVASRGPRSRLGSDGNRARTPSPGRNPTTGSRSPSPRPRTSPARLVEAKDVTQVFRQFDANGDGRIDRKELAAVLYQLDPVKWTSRNATLLLMSVDRNNDGFVDYSEFVEWVAADGSEQTEFRSTTGMPRTRGELAALEEKRKADAQKGTQAELDTKKAVAAHRREIWTSASQRTKAAHERYNGLKVAAEKAKLIFMPLYEDFRSASADVAVPAREVLEHDMKEAAETVEVKDPDTGVASSVMIPPGGISLTVSGMCTLFKAHPSTRANFEPDYWSAFLEAVLNAKLLDQMEQFDKECMPNVAAERLRSLCNDECFAPDMVKADTDKMAHTGRFLHAMCLWIHFLGKYQQVGVKKLWDQVYQAEVEMNREEVECSGKEEELKSLTREIKRLEAAMANA